ncbi:D-serine ammonia-lyase [Thalassobacillus sp. CUG 92003]|uniref:D-serine ammonia-lyase n=1 Tax=Thalassobacillus sp. CUG 92003 TaxID=2736641 RepID=UPI0015E76582|nr:D-serine ammonia-lyase [Thalassobacillus sp. CUG 92003]
MNHLIAGKTKEDWVQSYPLLERMMAMEEVSWQNGRLLPYQQISDSLPIALDEIYAAEKLFQRFAPFFKVAFPEADLEQGNIESPLVEIAEMKRELETTYNMKIPGSLLLKCDNALPIAGSIKARGGFYEIIKYTEKLALANGLLKEGDSYDRLYDEEVREFFSGYSIAVGSTGNLGLSIGILSAKIGFNVTVHMSSDAKQWKKDLLRSYGAVVTEYTADFSVAVKNGRLWCQAQENCYFVDDEDSRDLFIGYAVAALELKRQLDHKGITVDMEHPLIVYLPCGVGGGPGGVTYGLKQIFGDAVHCVFAEPTHSPSVLLGLMTRQFHRVSVQDFGIDNQTDADGLAVGRSSKFAVPAVKHLVTGIYTVEDEELFKLLSQLYRTEALTLEPSALAGLYGPIQLLKHHVLKQKTLNVHIDRATHIAWATGGNLVPSENMRAFISQGDKLLQNTRNTLEGSER